MCVCEVPSLIQAFCVQSSRSYSIVLRVELVDPWKIDK